MEIRAERGAARFVSKEAMWKYMSTKAGKHQHKYADKTIYCNVDGRRDEVSAARERAVRKVVRVIIESNGGNGSEAKKSIETDYKKGIVWFYDARVAEWRYGEMVLLWDVQAYAENFKKFCPQ